MPHMAKTMTNNNLHGVTTYLAVSFLPCLVLTGSIGLCFQLFLLQKDIFTVGLLQTNNYKE